MPGLIDVHVAPTSRVRKTPPKVSGSWAGASCGNRTKAAARATNPRCNRDALWMDRVRGNHRLATGWRRPVGAGGHVRPLAIGERELGRARAIPSGDVPPVGRDRIRRRVRGRLMSRNAVVEAILLRCQDIAFLVREELLDRIRLLDVRHEPVPDPRPG